MVLSSDQNRRGQVFRSLSERQGLIRRISGMLRRGRSRKPLRGASIALCVALASASTASAQYPLASSAGAADSEGRSVSVRRPAVEEPSQQMIDAQRERLFNELAEEFSMFDRLGNLVRRVSTLVKPSVIHIEAHKTEKNESYDEAGAGVVLRIGSDTWVMTNRHVIVGASPSEILLRTSDGKEFHPTRVLADSSTDVAVMKVSHMSLPPARMGHSDEAEIGDFVIAIGSPFGLSHSVTFGILSAKGRRDLSLGEQRIEMQDFFQTDAAINPGNSGGPLLNLRGEVIAINTAIASSSGGSEGIGFAIPINMAMEVAGQLVEHGKLQRGYLGVTLDPVFSVADLAAAGYAAKGGALVKNVRPGSPAELAHLQRGDIIVEFNSKPVDNDDHLVAQVGLTPIGKEIPMIIYREGKRYGTKVILTDMQ
ncbi:putative serine protease HtrA [Novipirellula artificiosorum]|uniref:Putative serine protease HtrA n=2 Tax=Novipirellula artificiosorum TaxID=2528016 RepID=A0A5C6DEA0_9BACT|nr:putative serine protease HtrA [Novipirellula artificiosorum]